MIDRDREHLHADQVPELPVGRLVTHRARRQFAGDRRGRQQQEEDRQGLVPEETKQIEDNEEDAGYGRRDPRFREARDDPGAHV